MSKVNNAFQEPINKFLVSPEPYFNLFDKYIPRYDNDGECKDIMCCGFANPGVLHFIMKVNPKANYTIVEVETNLLNTITLLYGKTYNIKTVDINNDADYLGIFKTMTKFDCIIMNPPYNKNLHLKILAKAIEHLKDDNSTCVNLSPVPRLTSIRNLYDAKTIKRNKNTKAYTQLKHVDQISNGIELFKAGIQQHLGIQVYTNEKRNVDLEKFVDSPMPKALVCKIMKKCMANNLLIAKQFGDIILPMSGIHGHIGQADFFNIMALTYEKQLKSVGTIHIKFKTESDRKAFYTFWMSPLGKLIVSLWKVDTHVMPNYIPYVWFATHEDFYQYFNITKAEQKIIEDTLAKYE